MKTSILIPLGFLMALGSHAQTPPQTGDPNDLEVRVTTSFGHYVHGAPVEIRVAVCNPTSDEIVVHHSPYCSPPQFEILDSSGSVVAFATCDGGAGVVYATEWPSQECRLERTVVWPQTSGRFDHQHSPPGFVVSPGVYRARHNVVLGSHLLVGESDGFVIAPAAQIPSASLRGLLLLAVVLGALAIGRLQPS